MKKLLLTLLLVPRLLVAEEEIFTNHLHSRMIVSPAQLYQVAGIETDVSINYRRLGFEMETVAGFRKSTWSNSAIGLTAVYSLPIEGLNIGLDISSDVGEANVAVEGENVLELTPDLQTTSTKYKKIMSTQISPMCSYWLNGIVALGLRLNYQYLDRIMSSEFNATNTSFNPSSSSWSLMPAMVVTVAGVEAGVALRTRTQIIENSDDVDVPAAFTLHGRYAVTPNLRLGGVYELKKRAKTGIGNIDQPIYRLTLEWKQEKFILEGELARASSFYQDQEYITTSNIATTAMHTAIDYRFLDEATVGTGLGYRFGSETKANVTHKVAELDLTLRGNYIF